MPPWTADAISDTKPADDERVGPRNALARNVRLTPPSQNGEATSSSVLRSNDARRFGVSASSGAITHRHRVVVVGGGFGGLQAAQHLATAPVDLTLVDRRNFHLFQPLTYQVATGALSPGEVAYPLRAVFR